MPARHIADLAGTRQSQFRILPADLPGAPTSGLHLRGEIHTDSLGIQWRCREQGTPGTWFSLGADNDRVGVLGSSGAQVVDTVLAPAAVSVVWELALVSGVSVQHSRVTATSDGTDGSFAQGSITETGTGFPDVSVDLSGGSLRLLATPYGAGWTAMIRRYSDTFVDADPAPAPAHYAPLISFFP